MYTILIFISIYLSPLLKYKWDYYANCEWKNGLLDREQRISSWFHEKKKASAGNAVVIKNGAVPLQYTR